MTRARARRANSYRMALKATIDSLPRLEAERREIDSRIAAADGVLEAAEKQHDETTDIPLDVGRFVLLAEQRLPRSIDVRKAVQPRHSMK